MQAYDLLIVGGGPGGVEAARRGAAAGLSTALIHNTPLGGRAVWSSLLPSKAWLQVAGTTHQAEGYPLQSGKTTLDHEALRQWINQQSTEQEHFLHRQLTEAGVSLLTGTATYQTAGEVQWTETEGAGETIRYRHLVVAGGSGPRFLPLLKPNMDRLIAPKLSPRLNEIPRRLIMMGGGVTGTEYAFAFAALGAEVTILQKGSQLLPTMDKEVVRAFTRYLTEHFPVNVRTGVTVAAARQEEDHVIVTDTEGRTYQGDYGFIAISRSPDLSFFPEIPAGLDQLPGGFLRVDRWSRTSLAEVYAVGDITGPPMMANRARSQAREAVRAMLGEVDDSPPPVTMEAIYTQPNVVQIGQMTPGPDTTFRTLDWGGNLKAGIAHYAEGLIRLHTHAPTGRLLGAAAFGHHAVEVLSLVQLAINEGLTWEQVSRHPYAHPSLSEVFG